MAELQTNVFYHGDDLDILRRYVPNASVDLIYPAPPFFNSNRDYNVILRDESGNRSDAQLLAFKDTWHWVRDRLRSAIATLAEEMVGEHSERPSSCGHPGRESAGRGRGRG